MMRAVVAAVVLVGCAAAQKHVSFATQDGGQVYADEYGRGARGVVLVHGGQFNKGSWEKQARVLEKAGFHVLAIDLRGYGQSRGPGQPHALNHLDVLAAVRYLRKAGARKVSLVGGSMGGGAAADAAIESAADEIDAVVMLGADGGYLPVENLKGRKLLIVARDDADSTVPRLTGIQKAYDHMPEPKRLLVLDGSAHAQFLFQTDQGDRVMGEIVRFLEGR